MEIDGLRNLREVYKFYERGGETKTCERKTPLHPTLREWLKDHKGHPFKIINHRKTLDRVKDGVTWQKDILRHTAISHFMGMKGNIYQVSEHLGNSPQIIKKHYQRTVLKIDNDFFWSLAPEKVKQIIKLRLIWCQMGGLWLTGSGDFKSLLSISRNVFWAEVNRL